MPAALPPKAYPFWLRVLLALASLVLILFLFKIMTLISRPSQYLNAIHVTQSGPGRTSDLQSMAILNFRNCLYLSGPIIPATTNLAGQPLFQPDSLPVMPPAYFSDSSGAVEVLALTLPITGEPPAGYRFNQPLHMLGWRTSQSGYRLFALAESKDALLAVLTPKVERWRSFLWAQGLIMAMLIFVIFWLLNMAVLSNPSFQLVQIFIVNLIFLVLLSSVLVLSDYALSETLLPTLGSLLAANLIFIPLSLLLPRGRT